jgi:FkbM family methyltransferase
MKLSYAQNLEDVVLWRLLGHLPSGVYIDVGANSPLIDSVTKIFYDAGWRGYSIEPIPSSCEELRDSRPGDIVIQKCATSEDGKSIKILEVPATGYSTSSIESRPKLEEMGHNVNEVDVQGVTLNTIWSEAGLDEVQFLKVDVEGMEKDVLLGIDLKRYRPWIIVIESISPVSRSPNYDEWEYLLTERDYSFAYFDGLNRFYVAKEKNEFIEKLKCPPNIVDDQILENILHISRFVYPQQKREIASYSELVRRQDVELNRANTENESIKVALNNSEQQLRFFKGEYLSITNSRFWHYTVPIRVASGAVRRLGRPLLAVVRYGREHGLSKTLIAIKKKVGARVNSASVTDVMTEGERTVLDELTKR